MRPVIATALMISTGVAHAAAPSDQFDLVCTGVEITTPQTPGKKPYESFTETLRVDLQSGQWCEKECEVRLRIVEVHENAILFQSGKNRYGLEEWRFVSRQDGEYHWSVKGSTFDIGRGGTCERAPFSGFPAFGGKV